MLMIFLFLMMVRMFVLRVDILVLRNSGVVSIVYILKWFLFLVRVIDLFLVCSMFGLFYVFGLVQEDSLVWELMMERIDDQWGLMFLVVCQRFVIGLVYVYGLVLLYFEMLQMIGCLVVVRVLCIFVNVVGCLSLFVMLVWYQLYFRQFMFQFVKVWVFCVLCLKFVMFVIGQLFQQFVYVLFLGELQMLNFSFVLCIQVVRVLMFEGNWIGLVNSLLWLFCLFCQQLLIMMYLYLMDFSFWFMIVFMVDFIVVLDRLLQCIWFQLFYFMGGVSVRLLLSVCVVGVVSGVIILRGSVIVVVIRSEIGCSGLFCC